MPKQFWVIGGEYSDMQFEQLVEGTSRVFGPFRDIDAARTIWRERSVASKCEAATRYTIVTSAGDMAAAR